MRKTDGWPFLLLAGILIFGCAGPEPDRISGNSSSSPNAFIVSGNAQYEDGSPASGQPVYLRSDAAAATTEPRTEDAVRTTKEDGSFVLPGLPSGDFGIEIRDGDGKAVYETVSITGEEGDTLRLPPLILKRTGALAGSIACPAGVTCPAYDSLLISIKGLWMSVWADMYGAYIITGIPEGTYVLRFDAPWAAAQAGIRITEKEDVTVAAGETTAVEKVVLPTRDDVADDPEYMADAAAVQAILDSNGITDPLEAFTGVQENRIVVLADETGQISVMPEIIGQLDALQILILYGGGITGLPVAAADLTGLLRLDLGYQGINVMPEEICDLESLVELNLNGNALDSLNGISGLVNLQFLYLENNNLSRLPDDIGELTMLRRLDLSGNDLTDLPEAITELPYLNMIDVSGNSICAPSAAVSSWLDSVAPGWQTEQNCGN